MYKSKKKNQCLFAKRSNKFPVARFSLINQGIAEYTEYILVSLRVQSLKIDHWIPDREQQLRCKKWTGVKIFLIRFRLARHSTPIGFV
jgi:hypothetical protein